MSRLLLLIGIFSCVTYTFSFQCIGPKGPVDWFVMYKIPKIEDSLKHDGTTYMYITSEDSRLDWIWSEIKVNQSESLLAKTLQPYYQNTSEGIWVLYNDQMVNPTVEGGGHTKGVIGVDRHSGFWMIHSIPHFPPTNNQGYLYPSTGIKNGQSILCLSLTTSSINIIGKALMFNSPDVYDFRESNGLENMFPLLISAAKGKTIKEAPWYFITNLQTLQNEIFQVFAKHKRFDEDLYELVSVTLKTDLMCETWLNEEGALPSACNKLFKILNIKSINIKNNIQFNSSKDHSKWAVGSFKPWTCIGDINRAIPQEKRGGGTVCTSNSLLWRQYKSIIGNIENCKTCNHL